MRCVLWRRPPHSSFLPSRRFCLTSGSCAGIDLTYKNLFIAWCFFRLTLALTAFSPFLEQGLLGRLLFLRFDPCGNLCRNGFASHDVRCLPRAELVRTGVPALARHAGLCRHSFTSSVQPLRITLIAKIKVWTILALPSLADNRRREATAVARNPQVYAYLRGLVCLICVRTRGSCWRCRSSCFRSGLFLQPLLFSLPLRFSLGFLSLLLSFCLGLFLLLVRAVGLRRELCLQLLPAVFRISPWSHA
mmetsp:Transcript_147082/g.273931  ORF Transcript_147082/g.273931 Transcript_147082/m.273931 type:complete len:247 (+) Transcript_147082:80-820(+)